MDGALRSMEHWVAAREGASAPTEARDPSESHREQQIPMDDQWIINGVSIINGVINIPNIPIIMINWSFKSLTLPMEYQWIVINLPIFFLAIQRVKGHMSRHTLLMLWILI